MTKAATFRIISVGLMYAALNMIATPTIALVQAIPVATACVFAAVYIWTHAHDD